MFWRHAVADSRGPALAGPKGAAPHAIPGAAPFGPAVCVVMVIFRAWSRYRAVGSFAASRFTSFPSMLRNACLAWISTLELSKRDSVLE